MRHAFVKGLFGAAVVLALAATAGAQTVVDGSGAGLDPALVGTIEALVTRDFKEPDKALLRNLHRSKARNGRGYCGEVALGATASYVPFHVIIETSGPSSLLLLSDHGQTVEGKETATRLLTNFGCVR